VAIRTPEQTVNIPQGRLAPIFLSHEQRVQDWDLFTYSHFFYEQHKDILQSGYGIVSGLSYQGGDGDPTEPPRETIVFDARDASEGTYGWELCYAPEPGVQEIVRLEVSDDGTKGNLAKTNNQGRFLPEASFNLAPEETMGVESRLLERLDSQEVQVQIEEVYEKRLTIRRAIVHLINKQAAEDRVFALGLKVNKPPKSSMFNEQIEAQRRNLETLGFTALSLYRPEWLEQQNT
jgi:hypothetical protein